MSPPHAIGRARDLLRSADRIVVLTGAGMSAESGVPTFRGPEGLWKTFRLEELATPGAFERDPRLVWEWYGWRRRVVADCAPHAGHLAIARAARTGWLRVVTQNVDGLHTRAARIEAGDGGPGPAEPLELHGSLFRVRCLRCGQEREDRAPIDASSSDTLPRCGDCGGLLRPAVVWFGEPLDADLLGRAVEAAEAAQVCLVVGTSAVVHPAAAIPFATIRAGGRLIEVNPERTPLTEAAHVRVPGTAADSLAELLA